MPLIDDSSSAAMMGDSRPEDLDEDDEDYSEEESNEQQLTLIEIQGMEMVAAEIPDTDDWTVESYAADSMKLARLRLSHVLVHSSQHDVIQADLYGDVSEGDDWTVESTANDSIVMSKQRLSKSKPLLARVTRRRASMGDMILQQEEEAPPPQVPEEHQDPAVSHRQRRRSSMSSAGTDLSSGSRGPLTRHKSMPYPSKGGSDSNTIPLWPGDSGKRQVAPHGTPAAA